MMSRKKQRRHEITFAANVRGRGNQKTGLMPFPSHPFLPHHLVPHPPLTPLMLSTLIGCYEFPRVYWNKLISTKEIPAGVRSFCVVNGSNLLDFRLRSDGFHTLNYTLDLNTRLFSTAGIHLLQKVFKSTLI